VEHIAHVGIPDCVRESGGTVTGEEGVEEEEEEEDDDDSFTRLGMLGSGNGFDDVRDRFRVALTT
jgi:hypothetical protein